MHIQYLEVVTTDVNAVCALYSKMHGVTFGNADRPYNWLRTLRRRSPLRQGPGRRLQFHQ
jgi:hypothetical protein